MNWTLREIEDEGIELLDTTDGLIHGTIVGITPEAKAIIEAAPDLLEALKQLLALTEGLMLKDQSGPVRCTAGALRAEQAIAKAEGKAQPYNGYRIAWELERTALGDGFYGNALRVAKDIPGITADDRSLLDRYATGRHTGTDHVKLQGLALRIDAIAKAAGR